MRLAFQAANLAWLPLKFSALDRASNDMTDTVENLVAAAGNTLSFVLTYLLDASLTRGYLALALRLSVTRTAIPLTHVFGTGALLTSAAIATFRPSRH